jgi:hypothetical protein
MKLQNSSLSLLPLLSAFSLTVEWPAYICMHVVVVKEEITKDRPRAKGKECTH